MYNQITSNKRKTVVLVAIFFALIVALGWVFSELTQYGSGGVVIAVVIASSMSLASYYWSDRIALAASGARAVTKEESPYVYRLVENLCITAGIPVPKIYIIPDNALNAFATGRDPKHASIALTTGIVETLENEELEGVIAHELSHIKNYDIRVMTVVVVLAGIVVLMADWFLRTQFFGGARRNREGGQGSAAIFVILGLLLAILSPLFAELIKLAVSRKREFLADASGSLLTRYPEGLARALEKIAASPRLARASNATAHLYIANPFGGARRSFTNLLSTHPPIEERVKKLREMA